jgi:hypothetical protein
MFNSLKINSMKKEFMALMSILVIFSISCNSQNTNDAVKQAGDIQKMVKENSPGYTPTSAEYYFKAKINGKDWVADEMMASDRAGRIIGKMNGESISLPFELRYAKTGAKTNFKNHAVDIFMNDDVGIWGGRMGEMEFTNVGDNYAEGKFYVTGTSHTTDKKLIITEGTFRIPITGE